MISMPSNSARLWSGANAAMRAIAVFSPAVIVDVLLVFEELPPQMPLNMGVDLLQTRHTVDSISGKVEAVELIQYGHIKGRCDRSLFLIAVNMKISVVFPAIREPVNECWVAVIGENYRPVYRQHGIEIAI